MAWSTPSTRATGYLVPASVWNSDVVNNPIALRAGAIAIASQAALDFLYASSATQMARLAAGNALEGPRLDAAGTSWEFGRDAEVLARVSNNGSASLDAGRNVSSVNRTAAGVVTVTFTTAIGVTNYIALAVLAEDPGDNPGNAHCRSIASGGLTVKTFGAVSAEDLDFSLAVFRA